MNDPSNIYHYICITMYIFYYGEFMLSVHTNLTVTDHFSSTIKTNEGHMIGMKKIITPPPHLHVQGHDIIQLSTNFN